MVNNGQKRGNLKLVMPKIIKFSLPLASEFDHEFIIDLSAYWYGFLRSELGQIYQSIPWEALVLSLGLIESNKGRSSIFSPQGKVALMFLKNYCGCSDQRLLDHLNGNLYFQFFCGILIPPSSGLKHRQLVSSIRGQLAAKLSIEDVQKVLATHWKPYLSDSENVLVDATCYESEVRYPTDAKLLWESVDWLYGVVQKTHKLIGLRMPRTKYQKWAIRYQGYCRKRKPRVKHRNQIKRALLRLLAKLLGILEGIEKDYQRYLEIKDMDRIETVKKVYEQQYELFFTQVKPSNRIISLSKDYLRPIVRGKEKKPVEFGAKVNKIQIDGINFIEHINFEAFHEGIRLKASISTARKLVGKVSRIGADAIYATNANRSYCTKRKIFTDFKPKGRKGKFEDQKKILRKAITKQRASSLEGSFGNEKNAYHLRRIRARTKENEILWIFFGIHTANAVQIGKRMTATPRSQAA